MGKMIGGGDAGELLGQPETADLSIRTITPSTPGYTLLDPYSHIVQGSITAFADYSGTVAGTVKVTSNAHGLTTGWPVTISGTTSYNATYTSVTVIDANNFYVTATWVANDATGTFKVFAFDSTTNTFSVGVNSLWAVPTSGALSALETCIRIQVPLLTTAGVHLRAQDWWETWVEFVGRVRGDSGQDAAIGIGVGDASGIDFAAVVSRRSATAQMEQWSTNASGDIGTPTSANATGDDRLFGARISGNDSYINRHAGMSRLLSADTLGIDYSGTQDPTLTPNELLYVYLFVGRRDAADATHQLVKFTGGYRPAIVYTPLS